MDAFLQQLLSGLANGGIYASVALALVMIYQATHHVNFAQGAMAMFSTYIAWAMIDAGLPYWAAFSLTLVFSFVAGVAIEWIIIRPVERAPVLNVVIVFIGLLLILNSLAGGIFSYTIKSFPSPFPSTAWYGSKYMSTHEVGDDRGDIGGLDPGLHFLPIYSSGIGDAGGCTEPNVQPACRHSCRLDVGLRLGVGCCYRSGGRNDGGADCLPRPRLDERHSAIRLRGCAARRY